MEYLTGLQKRIKDVQFPRNASWLKIFKGKNGSLLKHKVRQVVNLFIALQFLIIR